MSFSGVSAINPAGVPRAPGTVAKQFFGGLGSATTFANAVNNQRAAYNASTNLGSRTDTFNAAATAAKAYFGGSAPKSETALTAFNQPLGKTAPYANSFLKVEGIGKGAKDQSRK